jgi:ribonuclease BN (tRNA processing enzyme)
MQIQFLGTGGAFDYDLGNSAAWITIRGKSILLDCGNTVYRALREQELAAKVEYILITHCHDDHVGSLATLLLYLRHSLKREVLPKILVPSESFRDHLFEYLRFAIPHPEKYATFPLLHEISDFQVEAIDTFGLHIPGMPSFGYSFEDETEILLYSGDIGNHEVLFEFLAQKTKDKIRVFHDITFEASDGIHAYYLDLIPFTKQYEIFGYHHDHRCVPDDNPIALVAHQPNFLFRHHTR